jgi:hypothetical protein
LNHVDSGGPGCYSQLVILKEIMSRIAYDEDKEVEDLVPGDYFDFIGGTGFGACVFQPFRGNLWLNMYLQIHIFHVRNA